MISNPQYKYYQYTPYDKKLTMEVYEYSKMISLRLNAIKKARKAKWAGIVLGTLGRQGSPKVVQKLQQKLKAHGFKTLVVMLSEVKEEKLSQFEFIDCWVQVACPRLSIDWGHFFSKPILTAYEMYTALGEADIFDVRTEETPIEEYKYSMDFYRHDSEGPWAPNHKCHLRKFENEKKCQHCST